jgi:hypothetical protein
MDNENKTYTLEIEGEHGVITVENLTMNGTNYVSEAKVDTTAWPPTFKLIAKDEEGTVTEAVEHAKLLQQVQYEWDGGKWYLAFGVVSGQEVKNAEFQTGIDETSETAMAGLMAVTDLYETLIDKGVIN